MSRSRISIRSIARRTFSTYAHEAPALLLGAAVTVVVLAALNVRAVKDSTPLAIGALILSLAVTALFTGAVVQSAAQIWEGTPVSLVELVAQIKSAVGELILVGFIAILAIAFFSSIASILFLGLAVGAILNDHASFAGATAIGAGGAILLLAPGAYLLTIWSVAVPVVVLERPGGLRALGRSSALVRGSRPRVLAMAVLLWLTLGACGRALAAAHGAVGHMPAVTAQLLAATLLTPIPLLGTTALYFALRDTATASPPADGTRSGLAAIDAAAARTLPQTPDARRPTPDARRPTPDA
jgi:hypothetical protein